ncbi:uncharacterized protein LOC131614899 [Vicia villosa]|uniref:uncharacterized protein LOC131614899 n=1 Tax=Vicia villosa TaxID=3911 RepID=UPI00273CCC4E|nr:uncharacterized protein LOC131614899 [Vicia villosa]
MVDWGFLEGMLNRLGFEEKWIKWMMMCVSSVNYSVLVNTDSVGPIQPGRGLRQGDPLSPYLFILITEGLSALIKGVVARGDIHGVQICRGAPSVSYLLFTNDCFLFCRANLSEVNNIMEILRVHVDASGQDINLSKSEVFFSRNISRPTQEDLASIMGVKHVMGTGTYLGLPSLTGRSKKDTFGYVKDRIWKKINAWRSRPISKAGKEVMIKSVLQSIPSYIMSLFILPDGIVKDIKKMLNSFWWGGGNNPNCIKWMAWDRLTGTKNEGGLGFRDLKAFNMAMVAKRGWNLLTMSQSLSSKIFKARWSIGDGSNISVMDSPCLREKKEGRVNGLQRQGAYGMSVNDLLSPNGKFWNSMLIRELFDYVVAEDILQVPLVEEVQENKWNWKEEQNGCYSVRSGYRLWRKDQVRSGSSGVDGDWCSLWNIKDPPRTKHLLWRICRDCLPTRQRLRHYHVSCPSSCSFCEDTMEDSWHVKEDSMTAGRVAWFLAQRHGTNVGNRSSNLRWVPPVEGSIKCNVDAGYNNSRGTNRGWCMRDHMGSFMFAGAAWDFSHYPILEAEALALKEAIQSAIDMEVQNVIFESDSLRTVQAIHGKLQGVSEFSCIISSIHSLLLNFPNFEVKFVKRQANMVAHSIAKAANSWTRRSLFHMIPLCIEQFLFNDMN